jgi:hypothetical protein
MKIAQPWKFQKKKKKKLPFDYGDVMVRLNLPDCLRSAGPFVPDRLRIIDYLGRRPLAPGRLRLLLASGFLHAQDCLRLSIK